LADDAFAAGALLRGAALVADGDGGVIELGLRGGGERPQSDRAEEGGEATHGIPPQPKDALCMSAVKRVLDGGGRPPELRLSGS
jgi:hypothetical protein